MSIAEYCFISSLLTILGLLLIFIGIEAIEVLNNHISTHIFKKQDRKNREEFIDWLMLHFEDPNYKVFDTVLSNDKFRYAGNDGEVYSLYKLNDSLCDCVRKRGEEE